MSPTWYDVLGVAPDATADEIRTAWRAGIADLDPTERRFRSLNQAAEVLLDPERRAAYDAEQGLAAPAAPSPAAPSPATPSPAAPTRAEGPEEEPGEPDEEPGTEPAAQPPATPGRARSVPTALVVLAAALATALVVLAAVVWSRPYVSQQDVVDARTAAEQAVVPVLSYDYRTLDEDEQAASSYLAPDYAEDYEQLFAVIRENAPATETVVRVEVVASSIVRSAPGRVDVLMFVNRPTTNKQVTDPVVYRDQVTFSMVDTDGEWLVDKVSTTPPPA